MKIALKKLNRKELIQRCRDLWEDRRVAYIQVRINQDVFRAGLKAIKTHIKKDKCKSCINVVKFMELFGHWDKFRIYGK